MENNKSEYNEKLTLWDNALKKHKLPTWEELPELNLYMDQVIILMNKYLEIYSEKSEEDKLVTPSIINNYVKLKIIPSPVKKKYSRIHLAYLIMVCTLKQCLSISTIKTIVPLTEDEEKLKSVYEMFRETEKQILDSVNTRLERLNEAEASQSNADLTKEILKLALEANTYKLMTEKASTLTS